MLQKYKNQQICSCMCGNPSNSALLLPLLWKLPNLMFLSTIILLLGCCFFIDSKQLVMSSFVFLMFFSWRPGWFVKKQQTTLTKESQRKNYLDSRYWPAEVTCGKTKTVLLTQISSAQMRKTAGKIGRQIKRIVSQRRLRRFPHLKHNDSLCNNNKSQHL